MKTFIQETSLYPDIIQYFLQQGLSAIGETKIKESQQRPDIIFEFAGEQFIVEVKLDDVEKVLSQAATQVIRYAFQLGIQNCLVFVYPKYLKEQEILNQDFLREIVCKTEMYVQVTVSSKTWIDDFEKISLIDFVEKLKEKLINPQSEKSINFASVVLRINSLVRNLNAAICTLEEKSIIDKITEEVVDKLDLFAAIGDFKDKEAAQKQVLHLAAFLLFNQILFYNIFQRKTENLVAELLQIKQLRDMQNYFEAITNIDYKSIYKVNILGHIPNTSFFVEKINDLILEIKLLRAEFITHDLAGRFFHELIPFEVRKVLAAFYTHPNAADLLAGICIESADDSIIDPACGSGTLLVAAYKRKQFLYEKVYSLANSKKMHSDFVEKQITGIDIMPFAAHISTINLTMQNIGQITNTVRIATRDSLEMATPFLRKTKDGMLMERYTETIQTLLIQIYDPKILKRGAINADGTDGEGFRLEQSDAVIMNPPYSDREKMPQKWLDKLNKNDTLNVHCGTQVNLWGHFLILGDILVKENGFVGSVIPISFAQGRATDKIREFILKNHTIRYIIKPVGDLAFTEDSMLKDILLVTEKKIPEADDICKIVYFKTSIRNFKNENIPKLYTQVLKLENQENKNFDIFTVKHSELLENQNNLMHFLWAKNYRNYQIIAKLFKNMEKKKIAKFPKGIMLDGFHTAPAGLSELILITNPMNEKSRLGRANLIYDKTDEKGNLIVHLKNTDFSYQIPSSCCEKALRTLTGVKTMKLEKDFDYFITSSFADFKEISRFSKFKKRENFDWKWLNNKAKGKKGHFALASRLGIESPNTSVIAVYSDEPFITTNTQKVFPNLDKNQAKIFCLFFNSIIGIMQILLHKGQATGMYGHIKEPHLALFKFLDVDNLQNKEIEKLLLVFDEIKNVEFPSIVEQIEKRFPQRVKMDIAILEVLGYKKGEINELLPELYEVILSELKNEK